MRKRIRSAGRWTWIGGLVLALVVGGCASPASDAITVRVDYSHDEFNTQFIQFFPNQIQVHPGDTVRFVQDWTGEAHTVTFGTEVTEALEITRPLLDQYGHLPEDQVPPEVFEEFLAAECTLPVLFSECEGPPPTEGETAGEGETTGEAETAGTEAEEEFPPIDQSIAQPCVIEEGEIPTDGAACPNQDLGAFDGTESFYNSGFIGFETDRENVFNLQVSESIAPGAYPFFCAVHGAFQSGVMEVVPADQPIASPSEVNQETREELNEVVEPFRQVFAQAQGGEIVMGGESFSGNFSGLVDDQVQGLLNEFVPETITTEVNDPVTWLMFGPHSISFDVPEYFPIYETQDDGSVTANDELFLPAGGAPEIEEPEDPTQPLVIDGGSWDGSGFWSSGVLFSDAYVQYTLRFSNPGTYRYACLIHPPMVGTVEVSG
jgi:plastocyanin